MMMGKITGTERVRAVTAGAGSLLQRARDRRLRALACRVNIFALAAEEAPRLHLIESPAPQAQGTRPATLRPQAV